MSLKSELPKELINQVKKGRAVLFLGAGATKGARTLDNKEPPLGDELRDLIAERFLDNDNIVETLSWVSELAISATDLFTVQDFIADQFRDLIPSEFHALIPTFRWRGIATTNFDRVVETAYDNSGDAIQRIVPFLSNDDRVDEKLREQSSLALLKLHGCITRTHDNQLPLILTVDQYTTYKNNRNRLFQMLEEWGSENTIIFVGHKLRDTNLRKILLNLTQNTTSRPQYYLVQPNVNELECKLWSDKKITVVNTTFEDMLKALDKVISKNDRYLAMMIETEHPINRHFITVNKPSPALNEFLANDFEYIHEAMSYEQGNPKQFYAGFDLGWFPIIKNLDVRRKLTDKLIYDIILRREEDRPSIVEFYVIKAEAGAGKTVLLKRFAWDAAIKVNVICLFSRGTKPQNLDAIRQLSDAINQRIFLFIDNSADNLTEIQELLEFARFNKIRLTLISAERLNEWNFRCESLEEHLTDWYKLSYLSRSEIKDLVELLSTHDSLGPNLTGKPIEEQIKEFDEKAGRQLLVALHEATQGRPFEEILLDEYKNIIPSEAQRLYLTVCVLNRLQVVVRAGLISRVHDIPFEMFRDRFFKPLEQVVEVVILPWQDHAYKARHTEIAQIVFEQVLIEPTDRYNEYIRILNALNPMYKVDYLALRGLLRAKSIDIIFPKYEDAIAIYDSVKELLGNDTYFLQQRANYERIRSNGNLILAQNLLEKAHELNPSDLSIVHTLAEVLRARAASTEKKLERVRFRREAQGLLSEMLSTPHFARYAAVTYLKLIYDEVSDNLIDESSTDRDIDESLRKFEQVLENVQQRYPEDEFILAAESEFAKLLEDYDRSFEALKKARKSNPRDPYISSRLAAILVKKGDIIAAKDCIKDALNSNRGDKRLNFQYADLLRKTKEYSKPDELTYYYRRAFSKGDHNYESQFWYSRFLFESIDIQRVQESKEIFRHLRDIPMRHEDRVKIRDAIGGLDTPREFSGTIIRVEVTHGFISIDGRGDGIFFHENYVIKDVWDHLFADKRVIFNIGFNFRGPVALNVRL